MNKIPQNLEVKISEINEKLTNNSTKGIFSRLIWLGSNQNESLKIQAVPTYISKLEEIKSKINSIPETDEQKKPVLSLLNKVLARAAIMPTHSNKQNIYALGTRMNLASRDDTLKGLHYFNESIDQNSEFAHVLTTFIDQKILLSKILPKSTKELNYALKEIHQEDLINQLAEGIKFEKTIIDNFSLIREYEESIKKVNQLRPKFKFSLGTLSALTSINKYATTALKIVNNPTQRRNIVEIEYDVLETARDILKISSAQGKNRGIENTLNLTPLNVAKFFQQEAQIIRHLKNEIVNSTTSNKFYNEYMSAIYNFKKTYKSLEPSGQKNYGLKNFFNMTKNQTHPYQKRTYY